MPITQIAYYPGSFFSVGKTISFILCIYTMQVLSGNVLIISLTSCTLDFQILNSAPPGSRIRKGGIFSYPSVSPSLGVFILLQCVGGRFHTLRGPGQMVTLESEFWRDTVRNKGVDYTKKVDVSWQDGLVETPGQGKNRKVVFQQQPPQILRGHC